MILKSKDLIKIKYMPAKPKRAKLIQGRQSMLKVFDKEIHFFGFL